MNLVKKKYTGVNVDYERTGHQRGQFQPQVSAHGPGHRRRHRQGSLRAHRHRRTPHPQGDRDRQKGREGHPDAHP